MGLPVLFDEWRASFASSVQDLLASKDFVAHSNSLREENAGKAMNGRIDTSSWSKGSHGKLLKTRGHPRQMARV
jgi:hypothetical protein